MSRSVAALRPRVSFQADGCRFVEVLWRDLGTFVDKDRRCFVDEDTFEFVGDVAVQGYSKEAVEKLRPEARTVNLNGFVKFEVLACEYS